MPDLLHDLQAHGLTEEQARAACRVVAEWLDGRPLALLLRLRECVPDAPETVKASLAGAIAVIDMVREVGETP